jgi:hypothetical protein
MNVKIKAERIAKKILSNHIPEQERKGLNYLKFSCNRDVVDSLISILNNHNINCYILDDDYEEVRIKLNWESELSNRV